MPRFLSVDRPMHYRHFNCSTFPNVLVNSKSLGGSDNLAALHEMESRGIYCNLWGLSDRVDVTRIGVKGAVCRYFLIYCCPLTRAPADILLLGPSTRSGAAAWDSRYRTTKCRDKADPSLRCYHTNTIYIRFGIPAYSARVHVPIFTNYC